MNDWSFIGWIGFSPVLTWSNNSIPESAFDIQTSFWDALKKLCLVVESNTTLWHWLCLFLTGDPRNLYSPDVYSMRNVYPRVGKQRQCLCEPMVVDGLRSYGATILYGPREPGLSPGAKCLRRYAAGIPTIEHDTIAKLIVWQ